MKNKSLRDRLLEIFWKIRDRNFLVQINQDPPVYFIKLPSWSKSTFLDVYIKSGALYEKSQDFGIGHLLEHYLCGLIKEEIDDNPENDGRIDNEVTIFNISSKDNKVDLPRIKIFLGKIISPNFDREDIFDYERSSILNELNVEQQSLENDFQRQFLRERFVVSDTFYGKVFADHLANTETKTIAQPPSSGEV